MDQFKLTDKPPPGRLSEPDNCIVDQVCLVVDVPLPEGFA